MKIVQVTWHDCCTHSGWFSHVKELGLTTVVTVGYLAGETEELVHVASSIQGTEVGDVTVIPRQQVVSVSELVLPY